MERLGEEGAAVVAQKGEEFSAAHALDDCLFGRREVAGRLPEEWAHSGIPFWKQST